MTRSGVMFSNALRIAESTLNLLRPYGKKPLPGLFKMRRMGIY
jgi:hypothetical protein